MWDFCYMEFYQPRTIEEAMQYGRDHLQQAGIADPALETDLLICSFMRMDRIRIYVQKKTIMTAMEWEMFRTSIERRSRKEPVAYILNSREFYGRNFTVNENVLIPRPETEELIELALQENIPLEGKVLDVGTGSGCIAITMALERTDLIVDATDSSEEALFVAKQNANRYHLTERVSLYAGDLAKPVEGKKYHAILSNPPYIHPRERSTLESDVIDFEPHSALFHEDPAFLIEQILTVAAGLLEPGGFVLLETSPEFARRTVLPRDASRVMEGLTAPEIRNDLSGKERFLIARKILKPEPENST